MTLTEETILAERDAITEATKPGIFSDIPAAMYHRMEAVSSHVLQGFYRTPAHARELMLHPKESTKEQMFGQALHTRVLEPEKFDGLYLVAPKVDRRTKAGKQEWAAFEERASGRFLLDAGEHELIEATACSVERHPSAQELLAAPGMNEVTVIWQQPVQLDGEDGPVLPLCKARLDRLCTLGGDTFIVDLKSTRDASQRGFERECALYRYHMQLGWYALGLDAHAPAPRRVAFIAVEKERPFAVHVLELDALDLEQGVREARGHLKTLLECRRSGIFPGYGDGMGYMGLPQWAKET